MAVRTICVALLLATLPSAGCGTVANLARSRPGSGGKSPFGGVRQDVWCMRAAVSGEAVFRSHPEWVSKHYPRAILVLACAADVPLSFVADLVTWPYTAVYSYINQPIPVPPVVITNPPVPQAVPVPPVGQPLPIPPETPPMPAPIPPMMPPAPAPAPLVTPPMADDQPRTSP